MKRPRRLAKVRDWGVMPRSLGWPDLPRPIDVPDSFRAQDISSVLPCLMELEGYRLVSYQERWEGADPFVLYSPWGEILSLWEREPSYGELLSWRAS